MSKQQKEEKEKRNKKALFAFIALFASAAIIIGTAFAFFSDIITGSGTATAGTLDLTGSYTYKVNDTGSDIPIATALTNLNPGDSVVVKASVANAGTKSAWIRDVLRFTGTVDAGIAPYIYVYKGTVPRATLTAADTYPTGNAAAADTALKAITNTAYGYVSGGLSAGTITASTDYVSDTKILNGTVETESAGNVETGPHAAAFTIYFAKAAPNTAQGKTLNISATTQGLQYRNNTATPDWSLAVAL